MALEEPITLMFSEVFWMGNFGVCNYLSDLSFSCTGETPQRKKDIITAQQFYAGANRLTVVDKSSQ